jgi:glycosyltransferase involved in cell wall biosynthesis
MILSLAITTFNRAELLFRSFERVLNDPRIGEVVIVDDASESKYFDKILNYCHRKPKVRIHRNNINLGVYHNKYQSVKLSNNPFVIVFDSDNIIEKDYLDALEVCGELSNNTVYTPSFAKPEFDYKHLSGKYIDRTNVSKAFKERRFDCLINTMNCVVPRENYLKVYNPDIEPAAADSAYFNYRWLEAGGNLYIVPGMEYEHLIHSGSHYRQTIGESNKMHSEVMSLLKNMK